MWNPVAAIGRGIKEIKAQLDNERAFKRTFPQREPRALCLELGHDLRDVRAENNNLKEKARSRSRMSSPSDEMRRELDKAQTETRYAIAESKRVDALSDGLKSEIAELETTVGGYQRAARDLYIERDERLADLKQIEASRDALADELKDAYDRDPEVGDIADLKAELVKLQTTLADARSLAGTHLEQRDTERAKLETMRDDQGRAIDSLNALVTKLRGQRDEMKQERDIVTARRRSLARWHSLRATQNRNGVKKINDELRADLKHATTLAESVGKQRDAAISDRRDAIGSMELTLDQSALLHREIAELTNERDMARESARDATNSCRKIGSKLAKARKEIDRARDKGKPWPVYPSKSSRLAGKGGHLLILDDLCRDREEPTGPTPTLSGPDIYTVLGIDKASGSGDYTCRTKATVHDDGRITIEEIEHEDTPSEKILGKTVKQGQIDGIQRHLELHSDRFNALDKKVGENELSLKVAKKAIDQNASYAITLLDDHSRRIASVESWLKTNTGRLDYQFGLIQERGDAKAESGFDSLADQVDANEAKLLAAGHELVEHVKALDDHSDRLDALGRAGAEDEIKTEWCRIEIVEGNKTKARHTGRLDTLERNVRTKAEDIADIHKGLGELEQDVSRTKAQLSATARLRQGDERAIRALAKHVDEQTTGLNQRVFDLENPGGQESG